MDISGTKIKLAPLAEADWPVFKKLYTNPQVMKHVYDTFDIDTARKVFDSRLVPWDRNGDGWLSFSITELSTMTKSGVIGLKITDHAAKIAEVGFMLVEESQGKGFGSESLKLLIKFAFEQLHLNKLTAICSIHNHGSYKLLEKLGFVREGCLAQNTFSHNQYVDDYIYGLCHSSSI